MNSYRITDPSQRPVRKQCNRPVHRDKQLPNGVQRTITYLATLAEHRANGSKMIPLEVRQYRAGICDPCEFRNHQHNACSKCGCPLEATSLGDKLSWAVSKCPVGKWASWADTELTVNGEWRKRPDVWAAFRSVIDNEVSRLKKEPIPEGKGNGIVIVGGGKYFATTYCNVRLIRHHGCKLPIEVWYLGRNNEMPDKWRAMLERYNVKCIDADEVRKKHPMRILNGWELKFYAAAYSSFRQLIFLDADCFPMKDPTFTFDDTRFLGAGAVFQRDCAQFENIKESVIRMFGIKNRYIWDAETGAFMVDKARWSLPLGLTVFLNSYSDLVYDVVYGDKTTPMLAANILGYSYGMPMHPPGGDGWGLMQRWFDGSDMWQHRIHVKPRLHELDSFHSPQQFTTPQQQNPKQLRLASQSLAWSYEIDTFLSDLRKLVK